MFLFASLPVILVTAAILTAMQGINWLFVNVGMNVIYGDDEQYQEARNQGYDPFVESLPDFIKRQHKGEWRLFALDQFLRPHFHPAKFLILEVGLALRESFTSLEFKNVFGSFSTQVWL